MDKLSRAVQQRLAAEKSTEHIQHREDRLARLCGIYFGHLCERDDEQAATRTPAVGEGLIRVTVVECGAAYYVDYEPSECGRYADVQHIWCGPVDLMSWLGNEYDNPVPSWATKAADEDLKPRASSVRAHWARRGYEMEAGIGNDSLAQEAA